MNPYQILSVKRDKNLHDVTFIFKNVEYQMSALIIRNDIDACVTDFKTKEVFPEDEMSWAYLEDAIYEFLN